MMCCIYICFPSHNQHHGNNNTRSTQKNLTFKNDNSMSTRRRRTQSSSLNFLHLCERDKSNWFSPQKGWWFLLTSAGKASWQESTVAPPPSSGSGDHFAIPPRETKTNRKAKQYDLKGWSEFIGLIGRQYDLKTFFLFFSTPRRLASLRSGRP